MTGLSHVYLYGLIHTKSSDKRAELELLEHFNKMVLLLLKQVWNGVEAKSVLNKIFLISNLITVFAQWNEISGSLTINNNEIKIQRD